MHPFYISVSTSFTITIYTVHSNSLFQVFQLCFYAVYTTVHPVTLKQFVLTLDFYTLNFVCTLFTIWKEGCLCMPKQNFFTWNFMPIHYTLTSPQFTVTSSLV